MTIKIDELKWELIGERRLSLVGTKLVIHYVSGGWPYHVHRTSACHACCETLQEAKDACKLVISELMEMGVDP